MAIRNDIPVLICGGGPSGLATAIELARRNVPFRLIDIARTPSDKSKAIGIQARTLEFFENMGIADEFTSRGKKCVGATISHDSKELAHVSFAKLRSPFPYLLMLPQSETEVILNNFLERLGGKIEREVKLVSFSQERDGIDVTLQHASGASEETHADWLIGCDGAHSTVRHILNLPFTGQEYDEGFMLADVKIDWSLRDDELHVNAHQGWIFAAFPMPGNRWRLIADLAPTETPMDQTPSIEKWQKIVDERCPVPAKLSDPTWSANYRIHRRIVSKMREGHVFLVGDSGHVHSPAGAQGMNTGIGDAINLAWKLALVTQGIAGESLLDSYNYERHPVEKAVLALANYPLEVLGLKYPAAEAVRDKIVSTMSHFQGVQKQIRGIISEISVKYPPSNIIEEHALSGGPHAGERAPDGIYQSGRISNRLFDLLKGPEHKVLLFDDTHTRIDQTDELESVIRAVRDQMPRSTMVYLFTLPNTASKELRVDGVFEDEGPLLKDYGAEHGAVYLIRPDGYIGFRSQIYDAAELMRSYLEGVFGIATTAQSR
jgi:2-polyprenyl-6-methoxyphenol hydroxylase-like FAD-dependent oxidoreductase